MQAVAGLALAGITRVTQAQSREMTLRAIPSSGEKIPVVGMGTWITFDIGQNSLERPGRREVLKNFFAQGGRLIDSSPMYGSAEEVLGDLLKDVPGSRQLFAATKVWTLGRWAGVKQMENSQRLWEVLRFDLMQVHNLLDWEDHLETLKAWKKEGRIRYIGVTTSHGRRHEELEQIVKRENLDFVQFTYNVLDREAERRLLPLAAERGVAVIINRPFQGGNLFDVVRGKPLPAWAGEFDCKNWAQFFLKFVVSHPAVTCAIPATSNPDHMLENMGAGYGRFPDAEMRQRMARTVKDL